MTAYYHLNTEPVIFETAIRALAEGNSIRSTARIVEVDKDAVCDWLNRAAHQCRLVMLYLWTGLHVTECQLDELWSFVHTKERNLSAAEHLCDTYGDAWVFLAFAPEWRLVLAFTVGKRNPENANRLLQRDNLSLRQSNRRLTRKTNAFSKQKLLSYRVPVHFLDYLDQIESLFPPLDESHHGS